jgi:GWxTD domain-containing protein
MRALLAIVLTLALPTAAPAALSQLPRDAGEAMTLFESDPDSWRDGPVEYLILEDERDLWKELDTTDQRAAFITRFWDRRDIDLRVEGNPFKDAFYERVAYSNRRFRDTRFRGWRSDRGRIAVTLGVPDGERPIRAGTALIWTYLTIGNHAEEKGFSSASGQVEILFQSDELRPNNYAIAGSLGAGVYPAYVLRALEYSRHAAVGESPNRSVS